MAVPINLALYRLLVKQGADASEAAEAAQIDTSELATKADLGELRLELKTDLAELKADLTWRMLLMTGGFIAAVGALKLFT